MTKIVTLTSAATKPRGDTMISIRRLSTVALILAGGLLAACSGGGGTSAAKTQGKIDSANDDNRRLSVIEAQLAGLGVSIPDPIYSMSNIKAMDVTTLGRTRDLLNDFIGRARAVVGVTERKDVKVLDPARLAFISGEIGAAEKLRGHVDQLQGQSDRRADCDGVDARTYPTIARRGATAYVSGLDRAITRRVDFDQAPRVAPVAGSCTQLRVIFADRTQADCVFTVVMEQGTVVHDRSSTRFECY